MLSCCKYRPFFAVTRWDFSETYSCLYVWGLKRELWSAFDSCFVVLPTNVLCRTKQTASQSSIQYDGLKESLIQSRWCSAGSITLFIQSILPVECPLTLGTHLMDLGGRERVARGGERHWVPAGGLFVTIYINICIYINIHCLVQNTLKNYFPPWSEGNISRICRYSLKDLKERVLCGSKMEDGSVFVKNSATEPTWTALWAMFRYLAVCCRRRP